jgi:inward rectifier potassium channel
MKLKDHNAVSTRVGKQEPAHDENRDLGFGSVVASESKQRLLNRDGTFNVLRSGLGFWTSLSPYHTLLNASWGRFLAYFGAAHLAVNLTFACAYLLCGRGALEGPEGVVFGNVFLRAFFFSVETLSTIGYGNITPHGIAANLVVMAESFVGVLFVALATGLIFARFSRPTAKIIFSRNAVVAPYRGITAFMFRVINARNNSIMDLHATVLLSRFQNIDGRLLRQFYPLSLEREGVALFPLSWTVVHAITEDSPFQGLTSEDLIEGNAEVLIILKGIDETFSQPVHARSSYKADEIVWNAKFGDIYDRTADSGLLTVDIRKLHDIDPL